MGNHNTFVTMKVRKSLFLFPIFFWLCSLGTSHAQESAIQLELAPSPVPFNRAFTITVVIRGSEERSYGRFPDLPGFSKRGTSSTTVNDRTGITQRITQSYAANRPGLFLVPPFSMVVNGQTVRSPGGPVTVTADETTAASAPETETEAEEVPADAAPTSAGADAFLSLQANRRQVFVGEGFTVRLAFLVADDSRQEFTFFQLNEQIAQILPQIRPANCWEENFGISGEPQTRRVVLGGRRYTEYRVFEAAYFPLNTQPVEFRKVGLRVQSRPAGKTVGAALRTFETEPFRVQPQPLPPHPQGDRVAVGVFEWQESLRPTRGTTGQTLTYTVRLTGEGNLAGIDLPHPPNDDNFDFYPPDVRQFIGRRAGRVSGEKVFTYQLIPKKAGAFALNRYLNWTFFNPNTKQYVTLKPTAAVRVTGPALASAADTPLDALYANLDQLDSTEPFRDYRDLVKHGANLVLALLLAGTVALFWRSKQ